MEEDWNALEQALSRGRTHSSAHDVPLTASFDLRRPLPVANSLFRSLASSTSSSSLHSEITRVVLAYPCVSCLAALQQTHSKAITLQTQIIETLFDQQLLFTCCTLLLGRVLAVWDEEHTRFGVSTMATVQLLLKTALLKRALPVAQLIVQLLSRYVRLNDPSQATNTVLSLLRAQLTNTAEAVSLWRFPLHRLLSHVFVSLQLSSADPSTLIESFAPVQSLLGSISVPSALRKVLFEQVALCLGLLPCLSRERFDRLQQTAHTHFERIAGTSLSNADCSSSVASLQSGLHLLTLSAERSSSTCSSPLRRIHHTEQLLLLLSRGVSRRVDPLLPEALSFFDVPSQSISVESPQHEERMLNVFSLLVTASCARILDVPLLEREAVGLLASLLVDDRAVSSTSLLWNLIVYSLFGALRYSKDSPVGDTVSFPRHTHLQWELGLLSPQLILGQAQRFLCPLACLLVSVLHIELDRILQSQSPSQSQQRDATHLSCALRLQSVFIAELERVLTAFSSAASDSVPATPARAFSPSSSETLPLALLLLLMSAADERYSRLSDRCEDAAVLDPFDSEAALSVWFPSLSVRRLARLVVAHPLCAPSVCLLLSRTRRRVLVRRVLVPSLLEVVSSSVSVTSPCVSPGSSSVSSSESQLHSVVAQLLLRVPSLTFEDHPRSSRSHSPFYHRVPRLYLWLFARLSVLEASSLPLFCFLIRRWQQTYIGLENPSLLSVDLLHDLASVCENMKRSSSVHASVLGEETLREWADFERGVSLLVASSGRRLSVTAHSERAPSEPTTVSAWDVLLGADSTGEQPPSPSSSACSSDSSPLAWTSLIPLKKHPTQLSIVLRNERLLDRLLSEANTLLSSGRCASPWADPFALLHAVLSLDTEHPLRVALLEAQLRQDLLVQELQDFLLSSQPTHSILMLSPLLAEDVCVRSFLQGEQTVSGGEMTDSELGTSESFRALVTAHSQHLAIACVQALILCSWAQFERVLRTLCGVCDANVLFCAQFLQQCKGVASCYGPNLMVSVLQTLGGLCPLSDTDSELLSREYCTASGVGSALFESLALFVLTRPLGVFSERLAADPTLLTSQGSCVSNSCLTAFEATLSLVDAFLPQGAADLERMLSAHRQLMPLGVYLAERYGSSSSNASPLSVLEHLHHSDAQASNLFQLLCRSDGRVLLDRLAQPNSIRSAEQRSLLVQLAVERLLPSDPVLLSSSTVVQSTLRAALGLLWEANIDDEVVLARLRQCVDQAAEKHTVDYAHHLLVFANVVQLLPFMQSTKPQHELLLQLSVRSMRGIVRLCPSLLEGATCLLVCFRYCAQVIPFQVSHLLETLFRQVVAVHECSDLFWCEFVETCLEIQSRSPGVQITSYPLSVLRCRRALHVIM